MVSSHKLQSIELHAVLAFVRIAQLTCRRKRANRNLTNCSVASRFGMSHGYQCPHVAHVCRCALRQLNKKEATKSNYEQCIKKVCTFDTVRACVYLLPPPACKRVNVNSGGRLLGILQSPGETHTQTHSCAPATSAHVCLPYV